VCDIAIVCHIAVVCEMLYSLPVLEAAKTGSNKKIKLKGHASVAGGLRGPIYLSVNQRIYRPTCQTPVLPPNIFIDDVSPMNITRYIHQFHIIDEYVVIFVSTDE
jgi:hypothetical protein